MKISRGDIVIIDQPFSSGEGSKVRPVLILQNDRDNARLTNTIVAMITRTVRSEPTQLTIDPTRPQGRVTGQPFVGALPAFSLGQYACG